VINNTEYNINIREVYCREPDTGRHIFKKSTCVTTNRNISEFSQSFTVICSKIWHVPNSGIDRT